jgi:hypothetical protein
MVKAPSKHPNDFEHTQNVLEFIGFVVLFGVVGTIVGRVIDKSISSIQGTTGVTTGETTDSKLTLGLFFVLQMFANAVFLYVGFRSISLRNLSLDDWISSTFQGVLFVTMCFSVQDNFYANARAII